MLLLYERFTPITIKSRAELWHVLHTQGSVFSLYIPPEKKEGENISNQNKVAWFIKNTDYPLKPHKNNNNILVHVYFEHYTWYTHINVLSIILNLIMQFVSYLGA